MFSKHSDETVVLIADIGSGGVGVGVFMLHKDAPSEMLLAERASASLDERDPAHLTIAALAQLGEVSGRVITAYHAKFPRGKRITASYAIIRAPWSQSRVARAESKEDAERVVDGTLLSALAREVLAHEDAGNRARLFETSVVRVEINGYATTAPEGKRGTHVAVTALLSECEPSFTAGVEDALMKSSGMKPMRYSGTRALMSLVQRAVVPEECMIVDMTGEATDLVCIRAGVPAEHQIVSEGVHSILRRVAGAGMPAEALALIRMAGEDQCEDGACEDIKSKMAAAEPDLARLFGETFATLSGVRRLPSTLALIAHPDLATWLAHFFSRIDFAQFTGTMEPFSILSIGGDALLPMIVNAAGVPADTGLLVASILVNSEYQDD